jgi:hypothetical protein
VYTKGLKVTKAGMELLNVKPHDVCPQWNYTISPRNPAPAAIHATETGATKASPLTVADRQADGRV